jgi:hypothetical protein
MPKDAEAPEHHLTRIAHAVWRGLVFVNPDPDGVAPEAMLNGAFGAAAPDPREFAGEIALDLDCNWKLVMEHSLARGAGMLMAWPSLLVERGNGRMILHQIVPRSFQRTRIVSRLYLADGSDPAALQSAESDALALKAACDAAHKRLEADASPDNLSPTPMLAAFRARLRAG